MARSPTIQIRQRSSAERIDTSLGQILRHPLRLPADDLLGQLEQMLETLPLATAE